MIDDNIDEQPQAENNPTDFNDLHTLQSLDAVREQVTAAVDACPVPSVFPAPLFTADSQNQGQSAENEPESDNVKQNLSVQTTGGENPLAETGGSGGEASPAFDLSKCLGRFCMIEGESKYWDSHRKKVIKKTAFIDMLGKPLFNEWNSHRDRRMIDMDAVKKATQEISDQDANDLIERFVMLEGTLESFDLMRRQRVKNATIKENFSQGFDTWLKSERKQMIWHEDLVFDPTQRTKEKQINMFEGLPVKPLELSQESINEKCYGIRELLKHLCEEDIEITDWVLKWLALPLQQPGAKMATALLFHGHIQGAGKSLFFGKIMRAIYGKYSATLGQNQLDADYNDWASQNLYTVFEEIFNNQTRYKTMGGVKHLVTGDTIRIDKKFMNGWEESNHINFVFLSNEVQPLPLEENDRRFLVAWPEAKLPEDVKQMAVEQANNPECIDAFYSYLLNYDMGDFTANTEPPMTRAKQRIIDFGLPNWKTFFYQWRDGLTPYPYCSCLSNDLFTAYKRWCTAQNEKQLTLTKFATNLSTVETIRKKLEWHTADGPKRKQGICILTGDPPTNDPNLTKEKWLTGQIDKFRASIKGQYDDVPPVL